MDPERPRSIENNEPNEEVGDSEATFSTPENELHNQEDLPFIEKEKTIEQERGERTAKLVEKIYDKLPPHLASHFVEPSVVLTMAGHKGMGEYHLSLPPEEERQKQEFQDFQEWTTEINTILLEEGHPEITFDTSKGTFDQAARPISRGGKVFIGGVTNLDALEHLSKETEIPGIPQYQSSTGLEGTREWWEKAEETLKHARDSGELPNNLTDEALPDIIFGLALGYPDRAILDLADWISQKKEIDILESSEPILMGKYEGPSPIFDYYPEHAQNPGILENMRKAQEILKGFYESEWHKKLENSQPFLEAREIQENLHRGIYEEV